MELYVIHQHVNIVSNQISWSCVSFEEMNDFDWLLRSCDLIPLDLLKKEIRCATAEKSQNYKKAVWKLSLIEWYHMNGVVEGIWSHHISFETARFILNIDINNCISKRKLDEKWITKKGKQNCRSGTPIAEQGQ